MNVNGKHFRTVWQEEHEPEIVYIIDQRPLPHEFVVERISTVEQMCRAIKEMHVRGAGLIGAAAGYGMYLATLEVSKEEWRVDRLKELAGQLKSTRPTAVNLEWAIQRQMEAIEKATSIREKVQRSRAVAQQIADEDASFCQQIGKHGVRLIEEFTSSKSGPINILTHCNAGWLAFVDHGSATAPIYEAFDKGVDVHVWVDETRPRNQGARLTAWELGQHGVPHTVIADNTGGHLMQHGQVDLVITGTDRTTRTGDVANKIGTYLKALAAKDNGIPFYVALPSSTFDWEIMNGIREIPIEQRSAAEVKSIQGLHKGEIKEVQLAPENSAAANYAFDVTPARLISGLITERGICEPNEKSILELFPERI